MLYTPPKSHSPCFSLNNCTLDLLNVSTITTSGCVKFSWLALIGCYKHTWFCCNFFGRTTTLFLCKSKEKEGEKLFISFTSVFTWYLYGISLRSYILVYPFKITAIYCDLNLDQINAFLC